MASFWPPEPCFCASPGILCPQAVCDIVYVQRPNGVLNPHTAAALAPFWSIKTALPMGHATPLGLAYCM